ncbi:dihydroorotate dehydrogenase, partial [Candidatus Fermentibacterales bacterium]|nr:dihydroorotate dehydrogenase [Candidatus Fermentibacterales bacterium]
WGRRFETPVMVASGTGGFGLELRDMGCLDGVACIVTKATTLTPRPGNDPPRVCETRFGLLNSIGLANPGVEEVVGRVLPALQGIGCGIIVNVAGDTCEEFGRVAAELDRSPVPLGYEINVSCPNVESGMVFGVDPRQVERVALTVREATSRPFSVKLTPNGGDMAECAAAAAEAGADAVTVCNTFLGMRLDWRTGRPVLPRGTGGYSSPALLPLVVARVHQVSRSVDIPVIASGGVWCGEDLLELLSAGAVMVEVGTLVMRDPWSPSRLVREAAELLEAAGRGPV